MQLYLREILFRHLYFSAIPSAIKCNSLSRFEAVTIYGVARVPPFFRPRKGWWYFRFCVQHIFQVWPSLGVPRAPNLLLAWEHKCIKPTRATAGVSVTLVLRYQITTKWQLTNVTNGHHFDVISINSDLPVRDLILSLTFYYTEQHISRIKMSRSSQIKSSHGCSLICVGCILLNDVFLWLLPVAARSKALACGRLLAGIMISNPTGGMGISFLWVLCVVR